MSEVERIVYEYLTKKKGYLVLGDVANFYKEEESLESKDDKPGRFDDCDDAPYPSLNATVCGVAPDFDEDDEENDLDEGAGE